MKRNENIRQEIERSEERAPEVVENVAQRERGVGDEERKRLVDTANVHGGETWGNPSGHSGTRAAYAATGLIIAGFIIGGIGLTFGPHLLIWIGAAIAVLTGAIGMATHTWSDYGDGG